MNELLNILSIYQVQIVLEIEDCPVHALILYLKHLNRRL